LRHQRFRLAHQRDPGGVAARILLPEGQAPQLLRREVSFVQVHMFQRRQPVFQFGIAAACHLLLQLRELRAQRGRLFDLLAQRGDLLRDDVGKRRVGTGEEGRDVRQRHAEPPQRLDVVQPRDVGAVVEAVAGIGARRRRQQTDAVVVVQRAHRQAGTRGQFADLQY
jgi:hypothetical protein